MKTWLLRAAALGLAASLSGAVACGGSSSGCGGSTTDNNSSSVPQQQLTCGTGTHLDGSQCVKDAAAAATTTATHYLGN
jgi:hypothetical protein